VTNATVGTCLVFNDDVNNQKTCSNCAATVIGCFKPTSNATATCYKTKDDFTSNCQDTTTCPNSIDSSLKSGLSYLVATLFVQMVFELLWAAGFSTFAGYHSSDFLRMERTPTVLLFATKLVAALTQLMYFASVVAFFHLVYIWGLDAPACMHALTLEDQPFALPQHIKYFIVASFSLLFGLVTIGTYLRYKCPTRGELYRPSDDDSIVVPFDIDCRRCRERTRPHCLPDLFHGFNRLGTRGKCKKCCRGFMKCFEVVLHYAFSCCCWPCGICLERLYKYRHYIGP